MMHGVAGEDMEVGQAIYLASDGKWRLARTEGYQGVAAERIIEGDSITDDLRPGHFRSIKTGDRT